MPLKKSGGKKCVSRNISELHHHGTRPRSDEQIVAIAHKACGMSRKKKAAVKTKKAKKRGTAKH
jgi:hypothetical protein